MIICWFFLCVSVCVCVLEQIQYLDKFVPLQSETSEMTKLNKFFLLFKTFNCKEYMYISSVKYTIDRNCTIHKMLCRTFSQSLKVCSLIFHITIKCWGKKKKIPCTMCSCLHFTRKISGSFSGCFVDRKFTSCFYAFSVCSACNNFPLFSFFFNGQISCWQRYVRNILLICSSTFFLYPRALLGPWIM